MTLIGAAYGLATLYDGYGWKGVAVLASVWLIVGLVFTICHANQVSGAITGIIVDPKMIVMRLRVIGGRGVGLHPSACGKGSRSDQK